MLACKSHKIVEAVAADEWVNAAPIRDRMHSAVEDVAEVVAEAAENAEERKEWGVNTRKRDLLQRFIASDT